MSKVWYMTWFHGWLCSVDNVCSKGESGESDVFDRNCSRKRFVTKLSDRGNYYFFSDVCIGLLLVVFLHDMFWELRSFKMCNIPQVLV
jgi:hypothetical protein